MKTQQQIGKGMNMNALGAIADQLGLREMSPSERIEAYSRFENARLQAISDVQSNFEVTP